MGNNSIKSSDKKNKIQNEFYPRGSPHDLSTTGEAGAAWIQAIAARARIIMYCIDESFWFSKIYKIKIMHSSIIILDKYII